MKLTSRYKKNQLTGKEHHAILEGVRSLCRAWLRHEATLFAIDYLGWDGDKRSIEECIQFGSLDVKTRSALSKQILRWGQRVKAFIRESIVAGVMSLVGPRPLTGAELDNADRMAQVQNQFFNNFEADIIQIPPAMRPDKTTEVVAIAPQKTISQFIAQAEMYGNACYAAGMNIARDTSMRSGVFVQERRVHLLAINDMCETCDSQVAIGWAPIGSLAPIGDSECMGNCHCAFIFKDDDGNEWECGRGPLSFWAFGATG